jgi:hypothetical protein
MKTKEVTSMKQASTSACSFETFVDVKRNTRFYTRRERVKPVNFIREVAGSKLGRS